MKKRLKIFIAWLMLTLMLYNVGFCFLIIELSIQFNRNVIENILSEIDEGELEILKITDMSSVFRQGKNEIMVEGKMYDVKKEIKEGDIFYFYCIHDEKEGNCISVLNSSINKNSDSQNTGHSSNSFDAMKHLLKDYFHELHAINSEESINTNESFLIDDIFLSHNYFSVITPPPEA